MASGADTQLARMLRRPDPQLSFRWVIKQVPEVNSLNLATKYGIDSAWVEGFELPFINVKIDGVFVGGGIDYFPEFHDVSAFSVTFYGDEELRALKYLWEWKKAIKDFNTGLYQVPAYYKDNWTAQLLNGRGNVTCEFTYSGCWPGDTGQLTLDQESNRMIFNQTFSVDSMDIKFLR